MRPHGSRSPIPTTGAQIGFVPKGTRADMDAAVAAARRAFDETDWATRPVEERAQLCEKLGALLHQHKGEFAELLIAEAGITQGLGKVGS